MSIADRLLNIKQALDDAKQAKARAEGSLEQCMTHLRKDHNVSSLEEARKKYNDLQAELLRLEEQIQAGVEQLEKELTEKGILQ